MNSELIRAILPLVSAVWQVATAKVLASFLSFLSFLIDRDSFPSSSSGATGAHPAAQPAPIASSLARRHSALAALPSPAASLPPPRPELVTRERERERERAALGVLSYAGGIPTSGKLSTDHVNFKGRQAIFCQKKE